MESIEMKLKALTHKKPDFVWVINDDEDEENQPPIQHFHGLITYYMPIPKGVAGNVLTIT